MLEVIAEHERLCRHTRAPPVTISAISPYSRRSASAGTGAIAGRRSARPSAWEKSRLVTGSGAVRVERPAPALVARARRAASREVVDVDPGDVLAPAGDRAADAQAKRRQHLRERAAAGVEHDAGARLRDPHARARRHLRASASHATQTCARKSPPGAAPSSSGSSPRGRRSSRSPSRRSSAPGAAVPARAPPRAGACPARGCRGSTRWRARSSAVRSARRRGARRVAAASASAGAAFA